MQRSKGLSSSSSGGASRSLRLAMVELLAQEVASKRSSEPSPSPRRPRAPFSAPTTRMHGKGRAFSWHQSLDWCSMHSLRRFYVLFCWS
jgi:hypothetical protein